jgi:hypothetical protein
VCMSRGVHDVAGRSGIIGRQRQGTKEDICGDGATSVCLQDVLSLFFRVVAPEAQHALRQAVRCYESPRGLAPLLRQMDGWLGRTSAVQKADVYTQKRGQAPRRALRLPPAANS